MFVTGIKVVTIQMLHTSLYIGTSLAHVAFLLSVVSKVFESIVRESMI